MMNFYNLLKSCYHEAITPFELYSQMCDLCKGDLELKTQTRILYCLYKGVDIFYDISTCNTAEDGDQTKLFAYVKKYSSAEQRCLWAVVQLLHPNLTIPTNMQSSVVLKAQTPKRQNLKREVNKKGFQNPPAVVTPPQVTPMQVIPAKKPLQAKAKAKKALNKETLHVSNLLSDLVIQTTTTVPDFRIMVLRNGVLTELKKNIAKRGENVYINLDDVIADKIHLQMPERKYTVLHVNKVNGNLEVEDNADCFGRVNITLESGRIYCKVSAGNVYIGGRATEIDLQYTAQRFGNVDIRNVLGDVRISLKNVGNLQEKVFAVHGIVKKAHVPTGGNFLTLKAITNYGNVEIM